VTSCDVNIVSINRDVPTANCKVQMGRLVSYSFRLVRLIDLCERRSAGGTKQP